MRELTSLVSEQDRRSLAALADKSTPPAGYQAALRQLGESLGAALVAKLGTDVPKQICVVCTVEDADSLGAGMIDRLSEAGLGDRVRVVCFWNDRIEVDGESLAPILKEYREPCDLDQSVLVIVKSIISSACVVRTNLANMVAKSNPRRIFVAAPVMLKGAEASLQREFIPELSSRFEYLTLAIDDQRDGKMVVPGVGGDIYIRLGYGGAELKNRHIPQLVKTRRQRNALLAA